MVNAVRGAFEKDSKKERMASVRALSWTVNGGFLVVPNPRHFSSTRLAWPSSSSRTSFARCALETASMASSSSPMPIPTKQVLVPIAFGTEEIEAVCLIDILRRAGADVVVASVEEGLQVEASRRTKLVADVLISSCMGTAFDLVALPGGMPGSARLRDNKVLEAITKQQAKEGKLFGAICAAPAVALQTWGLLDGCKATCHPSFVDQLKSSLTVGSRVQIDGHITTSRGPGTSIELALSFVEQLFGKEKYNEVWKPLVMRSKDGGESSKEEHNAQSWSMTKPPKVLVPIANGSEEMEAIIIIDVLRRAGCQVVVASVEEGLQVVASRKVNIVADKLIQDVENTTFDLIVLPGGMPGAERLRDCESLMKMLSQGSTFYGAVCASPAVVFEPAGLLKGKKATCHPAFSNKLMDPSSVNTRVVIDGQVITSRGPGTTMEFTLAIVEKFFGLERAVRIAEAMVFQYP